jgi:hypothetical protein
MPITVSQLFQTPCRPRSSVARYYVLLPGPREVGLFSFVILMRKRSASFTASALGNTSATSGSRRTTQPPKLFRPGPNRRTDKLFKSYSGHTSSLRLAPGSDFYISTFLSSHSWALHYDNALFGERRVSRPSQPNISREPFGSYRIIA